MDSKTFLAVVLTVNTIAIIIAIFLIGTFISTQIYQQFLTNQNQSNQRFDNSTVVHDYLFHNITDLKRSLDPIIAQIPNATESKIEQDRHYNQTTEDFKKIEQVLKIKLQDHITLNTLNQSVSKIWEFLNGTAAGKNNGSVIYVPTPVISNGSPVPVENLTGVFS